MENFDIIKEAYHKFQHGDCLTDDELSSLLKHMTILEDMLLPLGMKFFLARKEISDVVRVCNGFKNARGDKLFSALNER